MATLIAGLLLLAAFCVADENEYRLMRYLMANYDKSVRPSRNASQSMNVTFGLALTQIIDVDERNQILTTNCWLNQMWLDYNLVWNSSDFAGIRVIRIPAEKVWRPDIILYNNADSQYNTAILSTNVIVTSEGNVTWLSSAIFKSSCSINVAYFPFDEQNCTMKFASWTYDGYQVNLIVATQEGDLTNYVHNGEWDLIGMFVQRHDKYYSCCIEPYPDITYTIVLRRRPLFYVFNLVLPCVLITGIALMSFYMPSDSGEKVTLGITTLLSMTVFLMVIGESMPPTSEQLPLIGIYYGVTISLVSFATALAVVTLNIHHRGVRGTDVPNLVKKIVFGFLAKITFIRLEEPLPVWNVKERLLIKPDNMVPGERFIDQFEAPKSCDQNGRLSPRLTSRLVNPNPSQSVDNFERQLTRVLNKLYLSIERHEMRLTEQDRRDAIKLEWQQVALVLDRFLLGIFVVSTVSATFGILYMSPHTRLFSM
uniref:Uncharacterized protein n=1 Tax=Strigamia maritima TaxID=126957 RepID=T1JEQ2_STRMM